jgi:predicted PurR-regulated permease PerM
MTDNLPVEPLPNPEQRKVEESQRAWKRLGMSIRSLTPNAVARALLVVGAMAAMGWLAVSSWPALLPFIVGGVLAYIVMPLVDVFDRVMPRILAAFLGLVIVLFGFVAIIWAIVPPSIKQIAILLQQIPPDTTLKDLGQYLISYLQSLPPSVREPLANAILNTSEQLGTTAQSIIPKLVSPIAILRLLNAVGFVLGLLVLPVWLLTVLKDKPRAKRALGKSLPAGIRADFWAVLRILDRSFGTFFRGQVLVSILVGLTTYLGFKFLVRLGAPDSPYFVLFAVLAGLFQLIPEVGPLINIVLVTLVASRISSELAVSVLVLSLAIQFVFGNLVKGRIEESVIDVNPALLVLFIVALGQLGFFWLFLAAPMAGAARDLFRYFYGRLSDAPRPAGLLPGESLPASAAKRQPTMRAARRAPRLRQPTTNPPDQH